MEILKKVILLIVLITFVILLSNWKVELNNNQTKNKNNKIETNIITQIIEEQNQDKQQEIIIEESQTEEEYIIEIPIEEPVYEYSDIGFLTHYGPDCYGCSGITASGYDVRNTIYYHDEQYGDLRIIAMDRNYPMYTVVELSDYQLGSIKAIVLDRGGAITGNRIDLLISSEAECNNLINQNVQINVLRWGI